MKLTEAREVLLRHKGIDKKLDAAIDAAVTVLPKGLTKPTAEQRFTSICNIIEKAKPEFYPFGSRTRRKEYVCWRQCVWKKMIMEGYTQLSLERITKYNHATIGWGITQLNGYIDSRDKDATEAWNELQELLSEYDQNITISSEDNL